MNPVSLLPAVRRPVVAVMDITRRCNLRCSYCFGQFGKDKEELALEDVVRILAELRDLGARRLNLSGGEPLLHRDIDQVIEAAVGLGYSVGVNSNGILVPGHLRALALVDNITISLDSDDAAVHERNRGPGSFASAIRGIAAAADAGIPLHLACTLTAANVDRWQGVLDVARRYGALVQFNPLYQSIAGDAIDPAVLAAPREKLRAALEAILAARAAGAPVFVSGRTLELMRDWPAEELEDLPYREKGHPSCLAGRKMVFIDNRGFMHPCLRLAFEGGGRPVLGGGVRQAYETLPPPRCRSCRWPCFIEYNGVMNLKPWAVLNLARIWRSHRAGRRGRGRAAAPAGSRG